MALNLEDVAYAYVSVLDKHGVNITLEDFNHKLNFAFVELHNQLYGNENSPNGWETTRKRSDSLRKALTSTSVSLTGGVGNLPSDYFHESEVRYGDVKVDVVTDYEYTERVRNAILAPSTSYPIARIGDGIITVSPSSITSVTLSYLKHPTAPVLVLKLQNGVYVYDSASSTAIDLSQEDLIDLVRLMCEMDGIQVGRSDITEYMNMKQAKEND